MPSSEGILRFRSADAAEVAETWKRFAPSSRLLQVDPAQCRLDWFSAAAPGISLIRYRMSADVQSSVAPEDQLFSCKVTTDQGGSESARGALDPALPWASNGAPVHARWDDSALVHAIVFDLQRAEQLARRLSGDDTLVVRVKAPEAVSRSAAEQWDRLFGYLASCVVSDADALDESTLLGAGLQRHALWTVLSTFPTTLTDTTRRSAQTTAAPRTVKRALSFIDAHAHEAITIDDVARAAHISTRGLQYAFRRSLSFTPSEYLRRARLAGAHDELLYAAPNDSVTGIARRWGFANAARFVSYYRQEYGEHPREALRRNV
ncbi:helix-turn-helix domain-containing protein [Leucobacter sp.]